MLNKCVINHNVYQHLLTHMNEIINAYQLFLKTHPQATPLDFYQDEFTKASDDFYLATGKKSLTTEKVYQFIQSNFLIYTIADAYDFATSAQQDALKAADFHQLKMGENPTNIDLEQFECMRSALSLPTKKYLYDCLTNEVYELTNNLSSPNQCEDLKSKLQSIFLTSKHSLQVLNKYGPVISALEMIYLTAAQNLNHLIFQIPNAKVEMRNHKFVGKLNFLNGQLNINDLSFQPYDEHYLKLPCIETLNVHYDGSKLSETEAHQFHQYFLQLANHDEIRALRLKQLCVAILLGLTHLNKAFVLYGPAGTGKSTFLLLLKRLALLSGSHQISNITFGEFDQDDALISLRNSKLAIGTDNADKTRLSAKAVNNFKRLTQHEEISCFVKFKDRAYFIFPGIIVQATNDIPSFDYAASSEPITDRLSTIALTNRFRNTSKDNPSIINDLTNAKTISRLIQYLFIEVNAFQSLASHGDELIVGDSLNESDSVSEYFKEIKSKGLLLCDAIPISLLHMSYLEWHKVHRMHEKPLGIKIFTKRINDQLKRCGIDIENKCRISTQALKSDALCDISLLNSEQSQTFDKYLNTIKDENMRLTCYINEKNHLEEILNENDDDLRREQLLILLKIKSINQYDAKLIATIETLKHQDWLTNENEKEILELIDEIETKNSQK